jgi:hypothetical protein
MKKPLTLIISFLLVTTIAKTQDFGYKTVDVGGEYQWHPDGMIASLQFAFNSKVHSSFLIRGGYNKVNLKRTTLHDGEEGTGWGGSVGYRYYVGVIPRRFFIGLRADVWNMNIHYSIPVSESSSKLIVFQPGLETGYTILINEQFFITPSFTATTQITLKTEGDKVNYGQGFMPMAGISAGWRF